MALLKHWVFLLLLFGNVTFLPEGVIIGHDIKVKIRGLFLQDTCFVQLVLVSSRTALYLVKEPASLLDQIQSIDTTTQEW